MGLIVGDIWSLDYRSDDLYIHQYVGHNRKGCEYFGRALLSF